MLAWCGQFSTYQQMRSRTTDTKDTKATIFVMSTESLALSGVEWVKTSLTPSDGRVEGNKANETLALNLKAVARLKRVALRNQERRFPKRRLFWSAVETAAPWM